MSDTKGWSVDFDYRRARVWHFKESGEYTGIITIRVDKGKTRRERYAILSDSIREYCKITIPDYMPSKSEVKIRISKAA